MIKTVARRRLEKGGNTTKSGGRRLLCREQGREAFGESRRGL